MQIFKVTYSRTHRLSAVHKHNSLKAPTVLPDEAANTMGPAERDLSCNLTGKQHASTLANQQTPHKENTLVLFQPEFVLDILPVLQQDLFGLWLILQ